MLYRDQVCRGGVLIVREVGAAREHGSGAQIGARDFVKAQDAAAEPACANFETRAVAGKCIEADWPTNILRRAWIECVVLAVIEDDLECPIRRSDRGRPISECDPLPIALGLRVV